MPQMRHSASSGQIRHSGRGCPRIPTNPQKIQQDSKSHPLLSLHRRCRRTAFSPSASSQSTPTPQSEPSRRLSVHRAATSNASEVICPELDASIFSNILPFLSNLCSSSFSTVPFESPYCWSIAAAQCVRRVVGQCVRWIVGQCSA